MTKAELQLTLMTGDWERDRWGHFKKTITIKGEPTQYRIKLQDRVVRLERQIDLSDVGGDKEWLRVASCFYKDAQVIEKDSRVLLTIDNINIRIKG